MAKELDQLQRAGILEKLQVGNQVQFSANTNHPVFPELSALLRMTVGLADVIVEALADVADRIEVAFVFGSVARGAEHAHSDVDLVIVGDVEFGELLGALYPAQQTLQREINPKIYSPREWASKLKSGSAFLREVMARPKIFLIRKQHDLDRVGEPRNIALTPGKAVRAKLAQSGVGTSDIPTAVDWARKQAPASAPASQRAAAGRASAKPKKRPATKRPGKA